jgi:RNase adaptor protein for sRNA GlmZ degradation
MELKITVNTEDRNNVFVQCDEAHIAQNFLTEDIVDLIKDLPTLREEETESKTVSTCCGSGHHYDYELCEKCGDHCEPVKPE